MPLPAAFDAGPSCRSDVPAVRLVDVVKRFRLGRGADITALDRVSLRVERGEFIALLGPSGCGKSTLLRLIASLENADAGSVEVNGGPPGQLARAHRLGVAFQDHALLPWLSVAANIGLVFKIAGRPVDSRRVEDLIRLVGLDGFQRARPKHLSGGMRQRAAIARALALAPELLLLDEPFAALDAVTRRQMNIELQRIWSQQRITTVLVTHAVEEALFLADRIIVMSSRPGRVVNTITVPFARPRGPEVARSAGFHQLADDLIAQLAPAAEPGQ